MATPAGLAVHDGVACRVITTADGLSSDGLRWVGADAAGRTWVGSDIGIDCVDADGTIHTSPPDLQPGLIASGVVDDGGCWLATAGGLARAWVGESGIELALHHTDGDQAALLLGRDGRDAPLVADSASVLHRWTGHAWIPLQHRGYSACGALKCIVADGPDTMLVGGSAGFCRVTRSGDLLGFVPTADVGGAVSSLLRRDDEVLVAVGSRLLSFDVRVDGFMSLAGVVLEACSVNQLWADTWSNVWASTQSHGLVRISGLDRFVEFVDLPEVGAVFAIRQRRGGSLVLGGEDGILLPSPLGPTQPHVHLVPGNRAWDVLETRIGETIVATDDGVVVVDSLQTVAPLVPGSADLAKRARALLKRHDGIWVGTVSGLFRVNDMLVTPILDMDGVSLGYVYSLWEDRSGRLWISTLGRGVWHETERGVERFVGPGLREQSSAYSVDQSDDGRLAIVADSCLYLGHALAAPDEWLTIALPAASWAASFAPGNVVLVATSSGLVVVDETTGEVRNTIRPVIGVDKWEFTTSRALKILDDGRVLCGITAGLVAVELAGIMSIDDRPEPYLADIAWSNAQPVSSDGVTTVASGNWRMDIVVRSDWRLDETECTFNCWIKGFDSDWPEPTTTGVFRYTSLPIGNYVIQAQIHSPLVGPGPVVDVHELRVVP